MQKPRQSSYEDNSSLTVILPNYNHGRFIARAIDALLSQERVPDEIIVVDDASTDDSLSVIQAYAAKSRRIIALTQPTNRGTVPALRRGLDHASGQLIYFAASDDWVLPGFFGLAVCTLSAYPDVGFFCGEAVLVDGETGQTIGYRPAARPMYRAGALSAAQMRQRLAFMDNWILTGSTIFRRDAILAAGSLDDQLGSFADSFLSRKIALTSGFCYAPQVVACWRIFASGSSRTTALDATKAQRALDLYPARIAADPAFPNWYAETFRNRWRFATARLALETSAPDYEFISSMTSRSRLDRAVLTTINKLPNGYGKRVATLAWLWLRLRPYRLTDLLATALARKIQQFRYRDSAPAQETKV